MDAIPVNIPAEREIHFTEIMVQTITDFQVFWAATGSAMEHIGALATMVPGGLLQSSPQAMPGTATRVAVPATFSGAATMSRLATRCVASGIINLFDNLIIETSLKSQM